MRTADRIAITGMGLVTSLGLSAATSLAAILCGIDNLCQHETVLVNGNRYGTKLRGAKIARVPEHAVSRQVHGRHRAVALLTPAIREAISEVPQDVVVLNPLYRLTNHLPPDSPCDLEMVSYRLQATAPAIQFDDAVNPDWGRCSFFESIIQAAADLRRGLAPLIIVGCVDSTCDAPALQAFADADGLKSDTNSEGIVAGEAAAAFVLELESHAKRRDARILGFLSGSGRGIETQPLTANVPSTAQGLKTAFEEAFASRAGDGGEVDMVIADLNGERARAIEWALCAARIFPRDGKARGLMHPADCTGDCGGAMGAVLLAAAIGVFADAPQVGNVAIATSDHAGARRVLCLESGRPAEVNAVTSEEDKSIDTVVDQHCDDCSHLWIVRQCLLSERMTTFQELVNHDRRINANLRGIHLAGAKGYNIAKASLPRGDAGDFFAASFSAFKQDQEHKIEDVLEKAGGDPRKYRGIVSALGWLTPEEAEPHIKRFLHANSAFHRYIGIAASAIHRRDPGKVLNDAACDPSTLLRARALRAFGELGRAAKDDLRDLQGVFCDADDEVRFAASWSAALAGDPDAVDLLKVFVTEDSAYAQRALNTALRVLEPSAALAWHKRLAQQPSMDRLAVMGAGIIGDTALIPWLLERMQDPALARLAAEAWSVITGVDLAAAKMVRAGPEGCGAGSYDLVEWKDPDQGLPWPDHETLATWWNQNKRNYPCGIRYLLGHPISEHYLLHVLRGAKQREREAAALELAVLTPGGPLIEVRGPAFRQWN